MTLFLLTISFLLHIVTFVIIYQLLKQLRMLKQDSTEEMEKIFDAYLQEIKEENRSLQLEINESKQAEQRRKQPHASNNSSHQRKIVNNYIPLDSNKPPTDFVETSLQSQILQLYDEGLSVDEIAKKLNCGKTEVDLTIKMLREKEVNT
ncbi:helix-turn-helix domain-containing protein [Virgibacillus sp. W0181]|uniref:helix-turn-helix domain-containing protein n=1 Tax=Virgibacillus sp. W0181 TaxID=3391581 RepID=UPI003F480B18